MKVSIEKQGVSVTEDMGANPDGSKAVRAWRCGNAEQAERHLPTWTGRIVAGDASAIRDAANEYRKQRDS